MTYTSLKLEIPRNSFALPQFLSSAEKDCHVPFLLPREGLPWRRGVWGDETDLRVTSASSRIFFFFFWWGAKFFRSESNFTATELNLFLNLLNSSNLHPQLSRWWCWVLDFEYNHNFFLSSHLESYQPNIGKTHQSNWFFENDRDLRNWGAESHTRWGNKAAGFRVTCHMSWSRV